LRRVFIGIVIALFCGSLDAQRPLRAGALPGLNLSQRINSDWKAQLNLEHRAIQLAEHRDGKPKPEWGWRSERTDLTVFLSRKYRLDQSFALGYMLRFEEGERIHRTRQQWARVFREYNFRWAYRIAADQTFFEDDPTEFRWRHRFTIEVPLSGQYVDPGEFYFKANNEYLFLFGAMKPQWESRWVPLLGYLFSDRNKVEAGLDFRRESREGERDLNSSWWTVQWYFAL